MASRLRSALGPSSTIDPSRGSSCSGLRGSHCEESSFADLHCSTSLMGGGVVKNSSSKLQRRSESDARTKYPPIVAIKHL